MFICSTVCTQPASISSVSDTMYRKASIPPLESPDGGRESRECTKVNAENTATTLTSALSAVRHQRRGGANVMRAKSIWARRNCLHSHTCRLTARSTWKSADMTHVSMSLCSCPTVFCEASCKAFAALSQYTAATACLSPEGPGVPSKGGRAPTTHRVVRNGHIKIRSKSATKTVTKNRHTTTAHDSVKTYSTNTPTRRRIDGKRTSRGSSGMLSQSVGIASPSSAAHFTALAPWEDKAKGMRCGTKKKRRLIFLSPSGSDH